MLKLALLRLSPALLGDQGNILRSMARGFHGKDAELDLGTVLSCLLIATAFVLAIWLLSRWTTQKERAGSYHSPRRLFRDLCRAHRLDRSQRWLLRRLARLRQLPQPAALFLMPECFASATLSGELQAQSAALEAIRARIFGESSPQTT